MAADVRRPIDRMLLLFAILLVVVGMVGIYSATALKSVDLANAKGNAFLIQQVAGAVMGLVLMLGILQMDLHALRENPKPLLIFYGVTVLLLASVFFFPARNGAQRWIVIAGRTFQPSELAKPLVVVLTAWWMVKHSHLWEIKDEAIPKLLMLVLILGPILGLIVGEPDLGTTFLLVAVITVVVFLGGAPKWIFAVSLPVLGAVGFAFIWFAPWRMQRMTSFLNPELDRSGAGFQGVQSLLAVGNGGPLGLGLGAGRQKLYFLPEAHTDFIYAVIAEEAGLVGTLLIFALFIGILWRGLRIARRVRDPFHKLCAAGLTLMIVMQAFMNMSVVLSIFPNKGIPLPFVSYGGTSLMGSLAMLGLLLLISKEASE